MVKVKRNVLFVLVALVVLLFYTGCSNNPNNAYVMKLASQNPVYNSSQYNELLTSLDNLFSGYKDLLPQTKDSVLFVPDESVRPMKNIEVKYSNQGKLESISGYGDEGKFYLCEFKYYNGNEIKNVNETFMEKEKYSSRNGNLDFKKILNIQLIFNYRNKILYSYIDYYNNSLYNVEMEVRKAKESNRFIDSEFYVRIKFADGEIVGDTISPGNYINNKLSMRIKQHIANMGLPPAKLDFLQPDFLKPQILLAIKEIDIMKNEEYRNIRWDIVWDAVGTGFSDYFGPWITGAYGAASAIACGL